MAGLFTSADVSLFPVWGRLYLERLLDRHLSAVGPMIPPTVAPLATPGIILVDIDLVRALEILILDHPLQPVLVYQGFCARCVIGYCMVGS